MECKYFQEKHLKMFFISNIKCLLSTSHSQVKVNERQNRLKSTPQADWLGLQELQMIYTKPRMERQWIALYSVVFKTFNKERAVKST